MIVRRCIAATSQSRRFAARSDDTIVMMMHYPHEPLSELERARLAPHVTNLDGPVFALTNLPETVKAALFARYSRYPGTLRRLFLDEFADTLSSPRSVDDAEGAHAAGIFDRVFVGFGDDSVAQLGGVHIASEWTSNLLTKILQRGRIASYLEQSTRYIAFDRPVAPANGSDRHWAGQYRYYRSSELGDRYCAAMDELFDVYGAMLPRLRAWARETFPRGDEPEAAYLRAINAKALDAARGLLPAASLSHMGIYASGQALESLVLHLLAHPLPEATLYGQKLLAELKKVTPSFLARVERPERGGVWIDYLRNRDSASRSLAERLGLRPADVTPQGPSVRLVSHHGDESELLCALLAEAATVGEAQVAAAVDRMDAPARAAAISELIGARENRRHRPGRGFERLTYRFEIVSDYGAFRDLQRHRLLTCQWQPLTPDLGADVTAEAHAAGCADDYRRALDVSASEYHRLIEAGHAQSAPYALCLAYRMRYVMDLTAREALHLCELRSGKEGHPTYRAVALEMARQIASVHPAVGAAMVHLDRSSDERLERIEAEIRNTGNVR